MLGIAGDGDGISEDIHEKRLWPHCGKSVKSVGLLCIGESSS